MKGREKKLIKKLLLTINGLTVYIKVLGPLWPSGKMRWTCRKVIGGVGKAATNLTLH